MQFPGTVVGAFGRQLSPDLVWCLLSSGGLIGSSHGLEHTFDSQPSRESDWLATLAVVVDGLAAQDLDRLGDAGPG